MAAPELKLRDLFDGALQCPTHEGRAAYLDRVCGDDAGLRGRLEELLRAHGEAGSFLGEPSDCPPVTVDEPTGREGSGSVIGPYKLLQKIGEGGMGTVFMAEQTQPMHRKVALKVIKPGMDSRQVIARFEAERQALAMMDHANIARVFDGGTTDNGRPYFVMELVHGVPITKYCDDNRLTPRERLELFVPVCQAIQHAHQKGVIHRDVKPTNVLVTLYDGRPVPKVIDFGVAKAIAQRLTERTLFTQFGTLVGTLEYMSPEQAEISALGVDTRSDIYSLGVLLYELLTGNTPLTHQRMREAAYAEILRRIKEEEPPRPSARLSESGEALAAIAANRHTDPAKLTRLVRRELDWIVMKALEKDRNRRYETANGFAMDVQRYLADEPVLACPPSAGYRFRKFARGNKRALVTAALLGAMLMFVAGSLGWMARDRAAQRGRNAEAVSALLDRCEEALGADRADRAAIALEAAQRRAEDGGAEEHAGRLARCREDLGLLRALDAIDTFRWTSSGDSRPDTEEVVARWRDTLADYGVTPDEGRAAEVAGRITGSPVQDRLLTALDWWLAAESSAGLRAVVRAADPDPYRDAVRDAVAARDYRAVAALAGRPEARAQPAPVPAVLGHLGGFPEERAREILESALRARPGDLTLLMTLSESYPINRPEGAGERVRWLQAALAVEPRNSAVRNGLAVALLDQGNPEEASAQFREAVWLNPASALLRTNLGTALLTRGNLEGALAELREAVRLDPTDANAHNSLGGALFEKRDMDEAIAEFREAIRLDPDDSGPRRNLGTILSETGDVDGAIAEFREAIRLDPNDDHSHYNLGRNLDEKGEMDWAIAAYREAIRLAPNDARWRYNLAVTLAKKGDVDGAIAEYREVIRLDPKFVRAYVNLGNALSKSRDVDGAIAAYQEAARLEPNSAPAWHNLGKALFEKGDVDGAIAVYKEAVRLEPANPARRRSLGLVLADKGDLDGALAEFREAVRLDPTDADAHGDLGVVLCDGKRDYVGAIAAFNEAIRLDPTDATFRGNLGAALFKNGDADGAIAELREAIRLDPTDAHPHNNLGAVLGDEKRDYDGAIAAFNEAIRLDPTDAQLHYNLGNTQQDKGTLAEAIAAYREAVRLDPTYDNAHNSLGWLLAVGPDGLRDGKQAVVHATRACELTGWKDPGHIDTLAAAYAEIGDFDKAIEFEKKALSFPDFAQQHGMECRGRLQLYSGGKPYRDPNLAPEKSPPTASTTKG